MSEQALQAGDLVTYDDAIHRVVHVDGSLVTLVNGKLRAVVRAADVKPLSIAVKGEPTWEDNCGRSIAEWCGVNVQLGEAKFEIAILTADLAALRIRCSDLEQQLSRERERALAWKQAADAGESEVARLTAEVTRLTAQPDKE